MGHRDGAHTRGSGGSGLGELLVIVLAVALLGPAVVAAAIELVHILIVAVVAVFIVAGLGLAAFVAWRVRHPRPERPWVVQRVTAAPPRPSPLPSEQRPALERPPEVHAHFHGVSAEDVAEVIRQAHGDDPPG